jgi:GDP-L-fucose synthase
MGNPARVRPEGLSDAQLDRSARVCVAGYKGLVGSAILRAVEAAGFAEILRVDRGEADLTDQVATRRWFDSQKPTHVFLAAARVGGIVANAQAPADFLRDNLLIQTHVIDAAYRVGVKKLLFLGSSCIYPKLAPQPLKEKYLLTGPLEPTNDAYALAKIAGIRMVQAYRQQYGFCGISLMPTNLYGPGDNFDLTTSHVVPALMRKFHEAKSSGAQDVSVWGTGKARRELMYVDDLADAALFLMERYDSEQFVNVGTGVDITIAELAERVRKIVGFKGGITYDASKPDGTPQKLLDISRVAALGWKAKVGLDEGIGRTYEWYLESRR